MAKQPSKSDGSRSVRDLFAAFAKVTSNLVGSVWSFLVALLVIFVWAVTGPIFHFSDTWQLIINTGTTVVTFLMVFLIQSTQNRDAKAIHLKLDELIRAMKGARDNLVDLESFSEDELEKLASEFSHLREKACRVKHGRTSSHESLQKIEREADKVLTKIGD